MSQHSTLCFRKHSRHRFLVTAPSIHENNFVLTSVWKGGRRGGGEARNRRRTKPEAAFFLFCFVLTYFPDPESKPSGGPAAAAAAAARRPRTASSSAGSLSEQSRTERKMRSDWEKTAPSLPPSLHLTLEQRQHSIPEESMWSSSPAVTGFLRSESPVTGYSG